MTKGNLSSADKARQERFRKKQQARRSKEKKLLKRQQLAQERKKRKISDEEVRETILQLCREAGADKAVAPAAVAQALLAEEWQSLLKRIRLTAVQLAEAGQIEILRKGEPADPREFKGLYKLRIVAGEKGEAGVGHEAETEEAAL